MNKTVTLFGSTGLIGGEVLKLLINDNYFEDLDKDKFTKIIDETKKGQQPKPGSYKGRLNSAPEIKRTTLNNL